LIKQITARALAGKFEAHEPIVLLDVRQRWEHETAALPSSILIPLEELPRRVSEIQPSSAVQVIVYCHHGIRSLAGAAILLKHGVNNVASLMGGIDAWSLEVDATVPRY
jgi:rhodanese-related sulfurtransferase